MVKAAIRVPESALAEQEGPAVGERVIALCGVISWKIIAEGDSH